MDEPFGALDPLTRAEMQDMLRTLLLQLKKTVVLVTHDLDEALYLAQRILLLSEGKLIADLDPAAFLRSAQREVVDYVRAFHRGSRAVEALMNSGFISQYGREIFDLTLEHLWLTGAAMLIATAIAVPVGIALTRFTRWAKPVMAVANILQTIPSLAMFGFLLPLPWLGERAARIAIVALTAYALLPILRNTYAGIREIDPSVLEVARALGLTAAQRLLKVELPLVCRVHSRRAPHRNGHLRRHCHHRCCRRCRRARRTHIPRRRFRRQSPHPSRSHPRGASRTRCGCGTRHPRTVRLGALAMISKCIRCATVTSAVFLTIILVACAPPRPNHPVIGAKNFTEQVVLGELLAQEIEAKAHLKVERRFYLAGSYICQQALVAGRIDAYVEYTGTALTAILKQPVDRDPDRVLDTVRRLYASRYNVVAGSPLGFENTFAMVIRGDDARALHLTTLSQAAQFHPALAPRRRLRV